MKGKISFWATFLELFETYPKKSPKLAFIQGPSWKYSSCADLGPFHLAGRDPACQARQSHGEHSSLTSWEGADRLHILAFGMMWGKCSVLLDPLDELQSYMYAEVWNTASSFLCGFSGMLFLSVDPVFPGRAYWVSIPCLEKQCLSQIWSCL